MGRRLAELKNMSTIELLTFVDRTSPEVQVLCERLETYVKGYAQQRVELEALNEFKEGFYALSKKVDKLSI